MNRGLDEAQFKELKEWIAYDQSYFAERVREALRPAMDGILSVVEDFGRWSERFNHRNIMRRKLRRYMRSFV